ncbi:hypothetical protein F5884DRAFT_92159 [Xylogone sp. PMI_703]|nr:hypothetical protein F5884DRAFT_92159 [Xylogone sp. PMI_703]
MGPRTCSKAHRICEEARHAEMVCCRKGSRILAQQAADIPQSPAQRSHCTKLSVWSGESWQQAGNRMRAYEESRGPRRRYVACIGWWPTVCRKASCRSRRALFFSSSEQCSTTYGLEGSRLNRDCPDCGVREDSSVSGVGRYSCCCCKQDAVCCSTRSHRTPPGCSSVLRSRRFGAGMVCLYVEREATAIFVGSLGANAPCRCRELNGRTGVATITSCRSPGKVSLFSLCSADFLEPSLWRETLAPQKVFV